MASEEEPEWLATRGVDGGTGSKDGLGGAKCQYVAGLVDEVLFERVTSQFRIRMH